MHVHLLGVREVELPVLRHCPPINARPRPRFACSDGTCARPIPPGLCSRLGHARCLRATVCALLCCRTELIPLTFKLPHPRAPGSEIPPTTPGLIAETQSILPYPHARGQAPPLHAPGVVFGATRANAEHPRPGFAPLHANADCPHSACVARRPTALRS